MQFDPASRPTAKQLLRHRFFRNCKKTSVLQELITRKDKYTTYATTAASEDAMDEEYEDGDKSERDVSVIDKDYLVPSHNHVTKNTNLIPRGPGIHYKLHNKNMGVDILLSPSRLHNNHNQNAVLSDWEFTIKDKKSLNNYAPTSLSTHSTRTCTSSHGSLKGRGGASSSHNSENDSSNLIDGNINNSTGLPLSLYVKSKRESSSGGGEEALISTSEHSRPSLVLPIFSESTLSSGRSTGASSPKRKVVNHKGGANKHSNINEAVNSHASGGRVHMKPNRQNKHPRSIISSSAMHSSSLSNSVRTVVVHSTASTNESSPGSLRSREGHGDAKPTPIG